MGKFKVGFTTKTPSGGWSGNHIVLEMQLNTKIKNLFESNIKTYNKMQAAENEKRSRFDQVQLIDEDAKATKIRWDPLLLRTCGLGDIPYEQRFVTLNMNTTLEDAISSQKWKGKSLEFTDLKPNLLCFYVYFE